MNVFVRRQKLNGALMDLGYAADRLSDVTRILDDLAGAYPTSSSGASAGGASTILHCDEHERDNCPCGNNSPVMTAGDPTGNAAIAAAMGTAGSDPAGAALLELDNLLTDVARTARAVSDLARTWTTTTKLAPEEKGDPGCEIVGRLTNPATGKPFWEPVHVVSDVKGNLRRPYRLGRWAYEHILATNEIPDADQTALHVAGKRVPKLQRPPKPKQQRRARKKASR